MARRSEERRAELQLKYGNNAFTPIHPKYIEQARSSSARYILFANKDNKHGVCEKCMKDVEFTKTKHKEKTTCPNCGTELTIIHTWRKTKCDWNVDWYVVGEVVNENTFALRYIEVEQKWNFVKEINENAREVYDFKHGWSYQFSNAIWRDGWRVDDKYYFTEFNMFNHRRKQCCIDAAPLNNVATELRKMPVLKYFDKVNEYCKVFTYPRDNVRQLSKDIGLLEKLEKVGLSQLAKERYEDYWSRRDFKYKRSETSLLKMLELDRPRYNLLFKNQTVEALNFIRSNREMEWKKLEYIVSNKAISKYQATSDFDEKKRFKVFKYLVKQDINPWEYRHYLDLLKELNYKLDDSYVYPKDFRKADDRVTQEWEARRDAEILKKMTKQSRLIKKISDGLRKMPDLQEFLNGSNGLLVYVPESAKDLLTEGRMQHNCIGTYVDRIAEGKTLVFFVRRLEAPNDPFVAFEYVNGEVVQCRADHNENVTDDKIISFVDAFAERLRKNKVLYKAA